jgi:hypothetical protein
MADKVRTLPVNQVVPQSDITSIEREARPNLLIGVGGWPARFATESDMHIRRLLRSAAAVFAAGPVLLALTASRVQAQPEDSGGSRAYIDGALPVNQFVLRFDAMYDNNRPDRAEFLYPQYKAQSGFRFDNGPTGEGTPGRGSGGKNFVNSGRRAVGPTIYTGTGLGSPESRVDIQQLSQYLELKATDRLSGFVEIPERFSNPQINPDETGFGDMNAGFKYAFLLNQDEVGTFQLRTYAPTGFAGFGLGTNHVTVEPAFLYHRRLTDQLILNAELRDSIPIGGTDFEGNILRYGVGFAYQLALTEKLRLSPLAEFVGWTVLGGKETIVEPTAFDIKDALGDTIVNVKIGAVAKFGANELYMGYGRALTGAVWYKNMIRIEYRLLF